MARIIEFIKKETALVVSAILAAVSMIAVPPDSRYLSYVDYSVIGILFCLILTVAGFVKWGAFDFVSAKLITKAKDIKILGIILVNCVFFTSMLLTNDVALIAFVPITISIFNFAGREKLVWVVVLETIAANIGSSITPVGNPQNLYLYSFYHINILDFLKIVLPPAIVGYAAITCVLLASKKRGMEVSVGQKPEILNKKALLLYFGIFALCILTVLHIADYRICVAAALISNFIFDRKLFKKVDYCLLLTFVFFFIFTGNIERLPAVESALTYFVAGKAFAASVISSQVISNVPAAMMISRFTGDARSVLLGVNVGGLGTPIASLASLISFKLYAKSDNSSPAKYMGVFLIYNIAFLLLLTVTVIIF